MPADTDKCTPLSVRIGLKRSDTQKIEFGLTKTCKKVEERIEAVWVIHFALLEKDGDKFTAKISIDIDINNEAPGKEKEAEGTATNGISENQTRYLLGPVARAADKAVEQPFADEVRALFSDMNTNVFGDAAGTDNRSAEVLDRLALARGENMRRLRTRVISVLDIA